MAIFNSKLMNFERLFGGFHKWGYPKISALYWKIHLQKGWWLGVSPFREIFIFRNPTSIWECTISVSDYDCWRRSTPPIHKLWFNGLSIQGWHEITTGFFPKISPCACCPSGPCTRITCPGWLPCGTTTRKPGSWAAAEPAEPRPLRGVVPGARAGEPTCLDGGHRCFSLNFRSWVGTLQFLFDGSFGPQIFVFGERTLRSGQITSFMKDWTRISAALDVSSNKTLPENGELGGKLGLMISKWSFDGIRGDPKNPWRSDSPEHMIHWDTQLITPIYLVAHPTNRKWVSSPQL